jgi:hypothetical protein
LSPRSVYRGPAAWLRDGSPLSINDHDAELPGEPVVPLIVVVGPRSGLVRDLGCCLVGQEEGPVRVADPTFGGLHAAHAGCALATEVTLWLLGFD